MSRFSVTSKRCRTKTVLLLACAVMGVSHADVSACINTYGTDLQGHKKHMMEEVPEDYVEQLTWNTRAEERQQWKSKYRDLLQKSKTKPSLETRNDLAAAMMHLGKAKQALAILQDIEKKQPGKYRTATNLGTAYELSGDNYNALRWIKQGIKRNPESHYGSEWLHVKTLEAKIAMEKNPQWLGSHSVLGMNFGSDDKPQMPSRLPLNNVGKPNSADVVATALNYQLTERLEFTKSPDALVANLLFDLGNLLALNTSVEHAKAVYDVSLRYGPTQAGLVKRRIASANKIVEIGKSVQAQDDGRNRIYLALQIAAMILLPSIAGLVGLRLFKRRKAAL